MPGDDLREKVAKYIAHYCGARDASGNMHDVNCGLENCATLILNIPEIRDGLSLRAARERKVGYERQG